MQKSMYSLMLMDDVVQAIDELAYAQNTNRSNLINQILADYLSMTTPEKRMRDIFDRVTELIQSESAFQVQLMPSDAMISIRSPLQYKYRPTIRYSVELFRSAGETIGELKVIFRTQSNQLLLELSDFFKVWIRLEQTYLSSQFPAGSIRYSMEPGRLTRTFMLPKNKAMQSDEKLGEAIAGYIQMFDEILKGYLSGRYQTIGQIEKRYLSYLNSGMTII